MKSLLSLLVILLWSPLYAAPAVDQRPPLPGGAACVMAKWQGNTLDYALVMGKDHPVEAQEEAGRMLAAKGYDSYKKNVDVRHAQGLTNLPHAYVIVLKTTYKTYLGKDRSSYGCGFSADSHDDALWEAIRDLQRFSWGWVPDRDGYQIIQKTRY